MIDVKTKFISVLFFRVEPSDLPGVAREASLVMQRKGGALRGFLEGVVMANEAKTELLLVSQWESRHAWSAAQWDQDVGRTMGDLVESAKSFELRTYEPITIVRSD